MTGSSVAKSCFILLKWADAMNTNIRAQGVQSGMLLRRENVRTSRSYLSKDHCQQHDENEHKEAESKPSNYP